MRARNVLLFSSVLALTALVQACSGDDTNPGGPGSTTSSDAGAKPDGTAADGATPAHDGGTDATTATDGSASTDASTGSDGNSSTDANTGTDGNTATDAGDAGTPDAGPESDAGDASVSQVLFTTVAPGTRAVQALINEGTAIGAGSNNGGTPGTLTDLAADPNNYDVVDSGVDPFQTSGHVTDKAAGFCDYPTDGGAIKRIQHITGASFETLPTDGGLGTDPMVPMAPAYFPLVYNSTVTTAGHAVVGSTPIIGLFDYRPKDLDEALLVAESDDFGKTWYFMQLLLELYPDYSNPTSGGFVDGGADYCPPAVTGTNASTTSPNGSSADDGWGHATILQLPGYTGGEGQFLYLLDRSEANDPALGLPIVDNAPLHVIPLTNVSDKFPVWNTNKTNNDIKSISTALSNTPDSGAPVEVKATTGLLNPDGILAVFPSSPSATQGSELTVMYVQKIVNGDEDADAGTALPASQQCQAAPFSGSTNHDISNVRLATTTNGVDFVDQGIVQGLNDPTTVDYNQTRWISPRGTLIDVKGDGSVWGLYFGGGNCLDGDSDAFHYIGYAESTDKVHWTVFNDINHPIASINTITTKNQAGGATVTIPATPPIVPTESWFAQRLYAPTAVLVDATHLSLTFAGYGVQSPKTDLLNYRQIGNVELTVSKPITVAPNNANTH